MSGSIDLSLDRIRGLLSHLPPYARPTCHIAGTNGKGSVSALLSSILAASSYSVGRFNSPHLVSVHDSITLNNEPVALNVYESTRRRVESTDKEHGTACSKFELLTATALLIFEEAKLDIVVLEVGMGGRLDATNVIPDDCVLVSALTAVDLDHQAFLGSSVREIAREKASIARPSKPFVLGPQSPVHGTEVEAAVREVVRSVQGEVIVAPLPTKRDWASSADGHSPSPTRLVPSALGPDGLPPFAQPVSFALPGLPDSPDMVYTLLPLQGEHQLGNLGTAIAIVSELLECPHPTLDFKGRITTHSISRGVQSTRWPGRLSFHTVTLPVSASPQRSSLKKPFLVLVDGAHNPASSATLSAFIAKTLEDVTQAPEGASPAVPVTPRTISLTYLLALSHSPPKTPAQTLEPLLALDIELPPHSHVQVVRRVGLLQFTPPQDMPWVKPEPPEELRDIVHSLLPSAEVWTPHQEHLGEQQLRAALDWVAERQLTDTHDSEDSEGLIIIAGSLYLVADFYRLLRIET
jgi:dihydrofolate synthase